MRTISLLLVLLVSACQSLQMPHGHGSKAPAKLERPDPQQVVILNSTTVDDVLPELLEARIIYIGEQHDQYSHHLLQRQVIQYLHEHGKTLRVGLEMFQQRFQGALDRYVAGDSDLDKLLRESEYFQRWGYAPQLYQPILSYAQEQQIPLVALNIPSEITRQIATKGLDGLAPEERQTLPTDFDRSDELYRQRLQAIFGAHEHASEDGFTRFYEAQLAWDEGMAAKIEQQVEAYPDSTLVILAGSGHLAYRSGIPARVNHVASHATKLLLADPEAYELRPGLADYVLWPAPASAPTKGSMGALLKPAKNGGLAIEKCAKGSACEKVGLKADDQIVSINAQPIASSSDLQLALWMLKAGEQIELKIERKPWFGKAREIEFTLTLQ